MEDRALAGSRIRARRIDRGMRQAELAEAAGISASYLNLIEHNRRRIGGGLLNRIARALAVEPAVLAEGAEGTLIAALRGAAAAAPRTTAEPAAAEEFAGRFPGWAALVAHQARRIAALEEEVAALTDRLGHDPQLAASLHQVLSAVTAIRATSSILAGAEEIDRDWQRRFQKNLHEDAVRLAEESRALVAYLEGPEEAAARSPLEALEAALEAVDQHLPELEAGGPEAEARAAALAGEAGPLGADWAARYQADAAALPLARFGPAALEAGHEPAALARRFGVPPAMVLRRLSTLPKEQGHPAFGLAVADGSGALLRLRQIPGFGLPRAGGCPLWPLYLALGAPGRPIRSTVAQPGERGPRFHVQAAAEPVGLAGFDLPAPVRAVMLVRPAPPDAPADPVGPACRICPRAACDARREASILPAG